MLRTETATQIDGCVDCVFHCEHGAIPEDRPNISNEIDEIWPEATAVFNGGINCDDCQNGECEASFSWKACELCGSNLGGDRFHMTVFS